MADTDIVALIIDAMVEDLVDIAQFSVPADDTARGGTVRAGRLQDDPQNPINTATVHPNYPPDRESWPHILAKEHSPMGDSGAFRGAPLIGSAVELGGEGSQWWWRRGSVHLQCFYTTLDLTRTEARQWANLFRRRVEDAIFQAPTVLKQQDSFGETVVGPVRPVESYIIEGGGPPNDWIWRGWIKWEVLTCYEP